MARTRTCVVVLSALLAGSAFAACVGDDAPVQPITFDAGGEGGTDGAVAPGIDAGSDVNEPSFDAATGCLVDGEAFTLCDGFDDGEINAPFSHWSTQLVSDGGVLARTTANAVSPPRGLETRVAAHASSGTDDFSSALVATSISVPGTRVVFDYRFRIETPKTTLTQRQAFYTSSVAFNGSTLGLLVVAHLVFLVPKAGTLEIDARTTLNTTTGPIWTAQPKLDTWHHLRRVIQREGAMASEQTYLDDVLVSTASHTESLASPVMTVHGHLGLNVFVPKTTTHPALGVFFDDVHFAAK